MPRKARVEFPGAVYHFLDRGDRQEAIFRDEADREQFLATLGQACERTGWRVHAFVLMTNHYHLLVETPQPGLPIQTVPLPGLLAGLGNLITGATGTNMPTIGDIISNEHYGYNALGQLTNTYRDEDGLNDSFGYDYTGQLTSAHYDWNGRSVSYTQDNVGNRSQVNDTGSAQSYSSNPSYRNQYTAGPAGAVTNGSEHEIAGYQGVSYSYVGDRQLSQVNDGGNDYQLRYDAFGRCVWRWLNGTMTYYVYDGAKPIYEYKGDGTRAGWNLYGKGLDEILLRADYVVLSNGQGYFYQQDRLGNVTYLTGFSGEVIESYRYDAFGQPATTYTAGVFNNRFKFTGREWNDTFGFYEYRARAYHPGLARFLSEDSLGFAAGDGNLFRYCGGDPVNFVDPSGLTGADPRFNTEDKNSGALGNWNWSLGGASGTSSAYGFWSNLDGTPTRLGGDPRLGGPSGGSGGPDATNQGGGRTEGGGTGAGSSGNAVPGYAVFYTDRVIVAAGLPAMNFFAGELGFLPGQLVFDGNGHVYSSSGIATPLPAPSARPAGFSGNFVAAFGREFASYNMGPVADAFNVYSLLVAKGMTLPAIAPAAELTAGYLGSAILTRNFGEVGDFASELAGVPGPAPTTYGGTLGFGWNQYIKMMLSTGR